MSVCLERPTAISRSIWKRGSLFQRLFGGGELYWNVHLEAPTCISASSWKWGNLLERLFGSVDWYLSVSFEGLTSMSASISASIRRSGFYLHDLTASMWQNTSDSTLVATAFLACRPRPSAAAVRAGPRPAVAGLWREVTFFFRELQLFSCKLKTAQM